MLAEFKTAYITLSRARYMTWFVVLGGFPLCYWLTGGFPPHAWRFLAQTLLALPRLWSLKGPFILIPFAGLVAQATMLFLLWVLLVSMVIWMAAQQWDVLRERHRFNVALHNAEKLIESDETHQEEWWQADTRPMPPSAPPSSPVPITKPLPVPEPMVSSNPISMWPSRAMPVSSPRATGSLAVAMAPGAPNPVAVLSHQSTFLIGTGLNPGIKRKNKPNEDNLFAIQGTRAYDSQNQPFGLFVIADGMGGHSNGQRASKLAIHHMRDVVIPALVNSSEMSDEDARELLMDGVQHANLAIYQSNRQEQEDMGTTITTALITDGVVTVANVGDSRTYLYSEEQGLQKVTRDHSVVAHLVESGAITPDDVYTHPRRNEIYRSLGSNAAAQIDTFTLPLEDRITLLLCSDGLWEMVRDSEIEQILETTLPDVCLASEKLVQAALNGGGLDNISVIVVEWLEGDT